MTKYGKIMYTLLPIIAIILSVDIWHVVNVLTFRKVGFMAWEGAIAIILIIVNMVFTFSPKVAKDSNHRRGMLIVYGFMIVDVLIMMNFATIADLVEKLWFYFHLSITAALWLLISNVGNIMGYEKKKEGFHISVYDKDSPIPYKLLLPVWALIVLFMGAVVSIGGNVLVSYPQFGIYESVGNAAVSSKGVAQWENIVFMVFPFAILISLFKKMKFPLPIAVIASLIFGAIIFNAYHNLRYGMTNMVATVIVVIFGGVSILIYHHTKTLLPIAAMHEGNNFWGSIFQKTVVEFAAFGAAEAMVSFGFTIISPIILSIALWIILRGRKRRGRAK